LNTGSEQKDVSCFYAGANSLALSYNLNNEQYCVAVIKFL